MSRVASSEPDEEPPEAEAAEASAGPKARGKGARPAYATSFNASRSKRTFTLSFELPQTTKNILMLGLVESALKICHIRSIPGISVCHVLQRKSSTGQEVVI